ncbi:MAG: hybrid sensor histidine kinase/response regulator, partial [Brevundimonas sp.]|nr:hybrid sensor histidine kinase/response regulator [Brevundimonas sp.]
NRLGLERSAVEGHGIGLALAKRLVELQGGAIGVVSAPGEGAIFWIELPAA